MMQAGEDGSNNDSKRRRAKHSKTRKGCSRCKQRHIKCDETKPTCNRCSQAGLPCPGYEEVTSRHKRGPIKRFRIIQGPHRIPLAPARKSDIDLGLDTFLSSQSTPLKEQTAIDFFTTHTLTSLGKYSPGSKLWTISTFTRLISDAKIRNIVIAIGLAHQGLRRHFGMTGSAVDSNHLESCNSSDSGGSYSESIDGDHYYNASLAYMRIDISSVRENMGRDRMDVAVACLLIVIYLSLYDRMDEAAVHMHCGLDIISEGGEAFLAQSQVHQEVYLYFIHIATSSWPIHPNTALYDLMQSTTKLSIYLTDLTPLQSIRADFDFFAHKIYQYTSAVTRGSFADAKDMLLMRAALLEESEIIAKRLEVFMIGLHDLDPEDNARQVQEMCAAFLRARLNLYKIFSQCVNTRYQTTYDRYTQMFDEAVNYIWVTLPRGTAVFGQDWHLFSVHLNVIGTLRQMILLCRHPHIRRKALEALRYCPQREGIIEAAEGRQLGNVVIDFEEAGLEMDRDTKYSITVPEENRLHFIECIRLTECQNIDIVDGEVVIRMMYRPDGDSGYVERRVKVMKESNRMPAMRMIGM